MHTVLPLSLLSLSAFLGSSLIAGQQVRQAAHEYRPFVAPASNEGEKAIKGIRVPEGHRVVLWAAEPLLANPVAFCFDELGRCYVAETFRHSTGVTDNRNHMYWLDDDLASRTVADRVAMYKKHLKHKFKDYEKEQDRVRLILDTDGDGKADTATVFADGFARAETGIGAGVLARKGNVYYTCIPDLWLLKDTNGDGKADVRKVLSTGYGVHVAFLGHDLHGLRMGPDGKLYFSIGDRGLNVRTREGNHLYSPDTGAVLRCDPDGANLEMVATGLRNPQELAFDDHGNLFTVDNNSDAGDRARLVYVVEGGDSGWRTGFQYGSAVSNRGPWHYEKLWHLEHEGQPAYILPPLAHISAGPSGFTHYPGIGLQDRYAGHFFLVDFRGNAGGSGVWSFGVKPKGASFEPTDLHRFVWSVLATDCEFGPDGGFYVSDWVQGWSKTGKGRIYRITDPEAMKKPAVAEARKLLAEGFDSKPTAALVRLLSHPHQQVRLEAQFALATKGKEVIEPLTKVAKAEKGALSRLHAVWALGQIARKETAARQPLLGLLGAASPEVRAQAAKTLGSTFPAARPEGAYDRGKAQADAEARATAVEKLRALLKAPEPRVRFFAAISIGKITHGFVTTRIGRRRPHGSAPAKTPGPIRRDAPASGDVPVRPVFAPTIKAVAGMLRDNADRDPYLRHAGVVALEGLTNPHTVLELADDESPSVRLAALLVMRNQMLPGVARFLSDKDPHIVAEAARAIHDVQLPPGVPEGAHTIVDDLPKLAALVESPNLPEGVLYRALNANFRLGKPENAKALARFASRDDAPARLRAEAVEMLGEWAKPARRDRVTGLTQDLGTRPEQVAVEVFKTHLGGIFAGPNKVRQEATRVATRLGIKEVAPVLLGLLRDRERPAEVRVEALRGLDALRDVRLDRAIEEALKDSEPLVRNEGRRVLARLRPAAALDLIEKVLQEGDTPRSGLTVEQKAVANRVARQGAFAILATLKGKATDDILSGWMDRLLAGKVPAEVQLDLLEAARAASSATVKSKLKRYEATRPRGDPLALYREALVGGQGGEGKRVFLHKAEVSCLRCHKLNGEGGEVGPDLTGIGSRQNRAYLLEAIVAPDKQIAKGFETVIITTTRGKVINGIVKAEDKTSLRLITPEGKLMDIPKKDIDDRQKGQSAMPADLLKHLSPREVRDLVEFLSGLKK
jgi:quinoprotein glucose dehydrogenase